MSITNPTVWWDGAVGQFVAEMRDKKTGRVWGRATSGSRKGAIALARRDQPTTQRIKYAIGWVTRHPILAGAVVGAYLGYRRGRDHARELRLRDIVVPAVAFGAAAYLLSQFLPRG